MNIKITVRLSVFLLLLMSCSKDSDFEAEYNFPDTNSGLYYYLSSNDLGNRFFDLSVSEWNDLENWSFWRNINRPNQYDKYMDYWIMYPQNRFNVRINDKNGLATPNADVFLLNSNKDTLWHSKTDNNGNAELWMGFFGDSSNVAQIKTSINKFDYINEKPQLYGSGVNTFSIPLISSKNKTTEVMFVIDATGSMDEEITYMQNYIADIIDKTNENFTSKFGAVFYRDAGDEYITRKINLTNDRDSLIQLFKNQYANGGGDTPEAVDEALEEAIENTQWNEYASARLIFMILDAPPHYSTIKIKKIQNLIKKASAKGIKIIPIATDGTDEKTEFFLRYLAIATNGTFIFVLNTKTSNTYLNNKIGTTSPEELNETITRIIKKYTE